MKEHSFTYGGLNYRVTDDGVVYGVRHPYIPLMQRKDKDGYLCVTLGSKQQRMVVKVHYLVGMYFVSGYAPDKEINHKNFNREDNRAINLEWITHKQNIQYSKNNISMSAKARMCGENNIKARFAQQDVNIIKTLHKNGLTVMEIIKQLYPTYNYVERKRIWNSVKNIVCGKTWQ